MKIQFSRLGVLTGGVLAAKYYAQTNKDLKVEWSFENKAHLPNFKNPIDLKTTNDVVRLLLTTVADKSEREPLQDALLNQFLELTLEMPQRLNKTLERLDVVLQKSTFLLGKLSVVDFAVFGTIWDSVVIEEIYKILPHLKHLQRWLKAMLAISWMKAALDEIPASSERQINLQINDNCVNDIKTVDPKATKERLQEGKFIELPGAEKGKVIVRFPPEASGYLHIGHAKAALLNQYYQLAYDGQLIMRFDDTNPAKENVDFEKVILEDLKMLEIKPDRFTHTSEYFDVMLEMCERLLKEGKAFVDDTPGEQMKSEREQRIDSVNRNNDAAKNLRLWDEMKRGTDLGKTCCVRAKCSMQSANGCMRDPTIYRCKAETHPRTGNKYKVYPTYDFACPIVDSIEDVTHVLRTSEYLDRDVQFFWFIDILGLRRPQIWSYSRLNMTNTVLSKRKLTWFVEEGLVDGWDDPRMPTVRGIIRRGMTVEGLKQFIQSQGSSRAVVFMEWDKIWAINKKVIDVMAPRYTALQTDPAPVPVNLKNVTDELKKVPLHPKNSSIGEKSVWISPRILIDEADAKLLKEGELTTFINYGNVMIDKINRSPNGEVVSVDATPRLDNEDFKKTLKLTWLADTQKAKPTPTYCVYFDHIISKAVLAKDEDFKQYIGHETRKEVPMIGDPSLADLKVGDIIQLQRRGFFRVDVAATPASPLSGKARPCILFHIPDGHTSERLQTTLPIKQSSNAETKSNTSVSSNGDEASLLKKIADQGVKIRQLKEKKSEKSVIDPEVQILLSLKKKFKEVSGKEWKPEMVPSAATAVKSESSADRSELLSKISEQGDMVRLLKEKKSDKPTVDAAVKVLLDLKKQFKEVTGEDWKPNMTVSAAPVTKSAAGADRGALLSKIAEQGDKVRILKEKKTDKAAIDAEVKELLSLKKQFKESTGEDWKPDMAAKKEPTPSPASGETDLSAMVAEQGDKVRKLKEQKSDKKPVRVYSRLAYAARCADRPGAPEVQTLLALKKQYKEATGKDWKPESAPVKQVSALPKSTSADSGCEDISTKITEQGDKIRTLKEKKSEKSVLDPEIQTLLSLKKQYKEATGKDWKPESVPVKQVSAPPKSATTDGDLSAKITEQGDKIRTLKEKKSEKSVLDPEIQTLLSLKKQYKEATGKDWKPESVPVKQVSAPPKSATTDGDLSAKITEQGDKIRTLKEKKSEKSVLDPEIQTLLVLKKQYKETTGQDWKSDAAPNTAKSAPKEATKPTKVKKEPSPKPEKPQAAPAAGGPKKQTRLGLEAKKLEDLPEWYSQVITKAELIEYYDVSGCYILRPWAYAIWEGIKDFLSKELKKIGVEDCYFPIFVSKAALEREKTHIADFSPEVAWVTRSGDSELAEHIAIRPTSETVMYPSYAKWIQSHRDLPLRLNQWNNVVRWEFQHPQPFLRTREFLWQEGHTAFEDIESADKEVIQILGYYEQIYVDLLAIPVIRGRKTAKEKFAGGDYTLTVEGFVPASGRGIQGATSHHLGQNFSKIFEIVYNDPKTQKKKYVYQNSWGITTRTIGVLIMIHGDDRGLVLPPRIAPIQVVIVPCGITVSTSQQDRDALLDSCQRLEDDLRNSGVKVKGDYRDNYSPGWKFNHWELKGVPIRVELGPKDMAADQLVAVRRATGEKLTLKRSSVVNDITALLETIQKDMLKSATAERDSRISNVSKWTDFTDALDMKNIILAASCTEIPCEDKIKKDSARELSGQPGDAKGPAMGAKALCIPLEQPCEITPQDKCINPSCTNKPKKFVLFGRSY